MTTATTIKLNKDECEYIATCRIDIFTDCIPVAEQYKKLQSRIEEAMDMDCITPEVSLYLMLDSTLAGIPVPTVFDMGEERNYLALRRMYDFVFKVGKFIISKDYNSVVHTTDFHSQKICNIMHVLDKEEELYKFRYIVIEGSMTCMAKLYQTSLDFPELKEEYKSLIKDFMACCMKDLKEETSK